MNNIKKDIKKAKSLLKKDVKKEKSGKNRLIYLALTLALALISYFAYTYLMPTGDVVVHFIDVGQGDATLIVAPGGAVLIDGGDNHMGSRVVDYLLSQNIRHLDYVIATHPHADHIGGLIDVINHLPINTVIIPEVVHTTRTFERFIDALENNEVNVAAPVAGGGFRLGDVRFTVLAPNSSGHRNLNHYSIVLLMEYGSVSFLFTGDAEELTEREIIQNHNIRADVLQVGHHGSFTSTTAEFLDEIRPKIGVISLGYNNRYGHPHNVVLNRLQERNILIYRTDYHGHVVISTDGRGIYVQ